MSQSVAAQRRPVPDRSAADLTMRRLLLIRDEAVPGDEAAAHRLFSASILLSAFRCLLGYVVFPIVLPALGATTGFAPWIGIPIAVLALVFDVRGIRRFWLADHRWRWPISGLYVVVMVLVTVLLVGDVVRLAR